MAAIAADDIATWPVGEPVRLLDHMRTITLEVILHAVLVATDERRRSALRSVLPPVVQNGAWTRVYPKSGFDCSGSYLNVPLSEIHQ